eukprot:COSAG01_NODE_35120_length_536_cov_6.036613_1_plen_71_part_10
MSSEVCEGAVSASGPAGQILCETAPQGQMLAPGPGARSPRQIYLGGDPVPPKLFLAPAKDGGAPPDVDGTG